MTDAEPAASSRPASGGEGNAGAPAALADPVGREYLRAVDPTLARLIDTRPDFRPRAWTAELPRLDPFGTLIFQVLGQQLSVAATRTILGRLEGRFGGRLPSPAELLAADPQVLRASGMSLRKAATLRAVAERFVDGRLSDAGLTRMSDAEVEAFFDEVDNERDRVIAHMRRDLLRRIAPVVVEEAIRCVA